MVLKNSWKSLEFHCIKCVGTLLLCFRILQHLYKLPLYRVGWGVRFIILDWPTMWVHLDCSTFCRKRYHFVSEMFNIFLRVNPPNPQISPMVLLESYEVKIDHFSGSKHLCRIGGKLWYIHGWFRQWHEMYNQVL